MLWKATTEWFGNLQNPKQYSRLMILYERSFIWAFVRSQRSGLCLSETGDLHTHSLQFSLRTDWQPDGCWGLCQGLVQDYTPWGLPASGISDERKTAALFCCRSSYYPAACVGSLLSVALFDCNFIIVYSYGLYSFTQFLIQSLWYRSCQVLFWPSKTRWL